MTEVHHSNGLYAPGLVWLVPRFAHASSTFRYLIVWAFSSIWVGHEPGLGGINFLTLESSPAMKL